MYIKQTPKELKHVQIYDKLYELITNGTFAVGYKLPTEPELAIKMGVSRVTLRRSLALLQEDGLISNIRGKGNFVTDPETLNMQKEYVKKIQHPFYVCCNKVPDDIETAFRFEPPTDYFTKMLRQDTAIIVITDRWYKQGDKAVGYSLSVIPIDVISKNKVDLNNKEEYLEFIEKTIYQKTLKTQTQFTFTTTGNFTSDKYNLSEHENFILILETLLSPENQVLMLSKHYIPADLFKLQINLTEEYQL